MHTDYARLLPKLLRRSNLILEMNQADEVNIDYRGSKDFEIDKVRRNPEWMKAGVRG